MEANKALSAYITHLDDTPEKSSNFTPAFPPKMALYTAI